MDPYHSVLMLALALFFVLLNAFFVVAEFAIVKVRKTRLEELSKNNQVAKLTLEITKKLDSYLSATQLGITLSSLALGWLGEPALARIIAIPFYGILEEDSLIVHTISFVLAFTIITLFHVVLGEIVPKSIAIAKTEKSALVISYPLYYFSIIFYPIIKLFDLLAQFVLRRIGIQPTKEEENAHSEEEIKIIVGESLRGGFIDLFESEIIKNAVDFSETMAKEIMTPRKDMVCLNAESSYQENLSIVTQTNYTRYPYCRGNKDNIIGMIHIRDLLISRINQSEEVNLEKIIRKMIIVPETALISDILKRMNKEQIHTALIIDEYGGTAGLLTMEDIIEEIMGDINDEHDPNNQNVFQIDEDTYELDGILDLESVEKLMNVTFDEECEQVTIGGYAFNMLGRLPVVGDVVQDKQLEFTILEMDGARIKRLKVKKLQPKVESMES
ncbi:hemolysin family protein [uncultured Helicobacter sp.]|uniref:hemolysin family protein n=1 Tax=uncultured Helicobacter sp. TaxID=175537 RepID=UPI00258B4F90|nr:hemolysin family protein [uncultured Helicobacter sp.]